MQGKETHEDGFFYMSDDRLEWLARSLMFLPLTRLSISHRLSLALSHQARWAEGTAVCSESE